MRCVREPQGDAHKAQTYGRRLPRQELRSGTPLPFLSSPLSHRRLTSLSPQFFASFATLIGSSNYVTKRQSIKLLGEILLDRANFNVMTKYISSEGNLKVMMNLLRDKSKNIQFEAFHVFKAGILLVNFLFWSFWSFGCFSCLWFAVCGLQFCSGEVVGWLRGDVGMLGVEPAHDNSGNFCMKPLSGVVQYPVIDTILVFFLPGFCVCPLVSSCSFSRPRPALFLVILLSRSQLSAFLPSGFLLFASLVSVASAVLDFVVLMGSVYACRTIFSSSRRSFSPFVTLLLVFALHRLWAAQSPTIQLHVSF